MPDMLVPLLKLPEMASLHEKYEKQGIRVRRALAPDLEKIISWVRERFGSGWASECTVAMCNVPATCFIATKGKEIVGFACCEATNKNFFGPTGVAEEYRSLGIGKALLLISLLAMRDMGYAYAIIGGAGPVAFYEKAFDARVIENSAPSIYSNMIES